MGRIAARLVGLALVVAHVVAAGNLRGESASEPPYTPIPLAPQERCTPSFIKVSVPQFEQKTDGRPMYSWSANAFLVGCAERLAFSKSEHRDAQEVLRRVILQEDMGVFAKAHQGAFRAAVAARLNEQLRSQKVTDVILFVSRGEY